LRPLGRLERSVEVALMAGLSVSACLLVWGLLTGSGGTLRAGIVLLMWTPVVRVVLMTAGMAVRREWLFALISLWVLGVLGSSVLLAARM
jgi:uncharacterized membrane protein